MNQAPATFGRNGIAYTLLEQNGKIALYAGRTQSGRYPGTFEVHIVRVWPERTINGKVLPRAPRLGANEEFGRFAWSYDTETKAREKIAQILGGDV